jgi:hypothetical protein
MTNRELVKIQIIEFVKYTDIFIKTYNDYYNDHWIMKSFISIIDDIKGFFETGFQLMGTNYDEPNRDSRLLVMNYDTSIMNLFAAHNMFLTDRNSESIINITQPFVNVTYYLKKACTEINSRWYRVKDLECKKDAEKKIQTKIENIDISNQLKDDLIYTINRWLERLKEFIPSL